MIRSVIQAGFGNQLFQYATAYALAKELGQELELDVSWFSYIQKNQKESMEFYKISIVNYYNWRSIHIWIQIFRCI